MAKEYKCPVKKVSLKPETEKFTQEVLFRAPTYKEGDKTRNYKVAVGVVDNVTGKFYPNDSFLKLYDENSEPYEMDREIYKKYMKKYDEELQEQLAQNPGISRVRNTGTRLDVMVEVIEQTRILRAKQAKEVKPIKNKRKIPWKLKSQNDFVVQEVAPVIQDEVITPESLTVEKVLETNTSYSSRSKHKANAANMFVTFIYKIADLYGITKILSEVFTTEGAINILNWVAFSLSNDDSNASHNFNEFANKMNLKRDFYISSQRWSEFFMSISEEKVEAFLKSWCELLQEDNAIIY
ncbi:hypothetical protein [Psittacicella hinzii]|uniref:Uncharacterized protein n=1 Tax=Psittacicella hinzii TaxID=2028575 RepID=A0A3A1Y9I0_9GAMM|nr:hypothetical protein [Psittacicella hinzii]RIY34963.1 hypothetical protein CKF58_07335 [Psittacicella hinzii]